MSTDTTRDVRREILEIAEAIAPTWERRREHVEELAAPVRAWLVEQLAPGRADTVLELGAGAGDTGFDAAERAGRLICTDVSPAMLDVARRRGRERGIANAEYRVMDGERIELGDASVDGVVCRFAYMLMPDPGAAFADAHRVLRPGGRLALAVWGPPERNPCFTTLAGILIGRGHVPPPEPPPAPGVFALGRAEHTGGLLARAGFGAVRTEEIPVRMLVADAEDYIALTADTAGPIGLAVRALPEAERRSLRAPVAAAIEPFAGPGGYALPGLALCAVATRPGVKLEG